MLRRTVLTLLLTTAAACSGSSGGGGGGPAQTGTNRARFTFDVDLQGVPAELVMEVEVVGNSGVTWSAGSNPEITGVIGTGSYTIYTAGELTSPIAYYVFTGENAFADFTEPATSQRFRVQWIETQQGMTMIVNPFGPGPVQYDCVLKSAVAL
ncbi:MAG: hypothetical protein KDE27_07895 [Planctomycetes bacterium]|nr:hypothetical protein [Planctomycetota bacterium]